MSLGRKGNKRTVVEKLEACNPRVWGTGLCKVCVLLENDEILGHIEGGVL